MPSGDQLGASKWRISLKIKLDLPEAMSYKYRELITFFPSGTCADAINANAIRNVEVRNFFIMR